jgi:hypothetical protein
MTAHLPFLETEYILSPFHLMHKRQTSQVGQKVFPLLVLLATLSSPTFVSREPLFTVNYSYHLLAKIIQELSGMFQLEIVIVRKKESSNTVILLSKK